MGFFVSICDPLGSDAPGSVSMRGFACLRQLEFPLEIVMSNIIAAACRLFTPKEPLVEGSSDHELDLDALFISNCLSFCSIIDLTWETPS